MATAFLLHSRPVFLETPMRCTGLLLAAVFGLIVSPVSADPAAQNQRWTQWRGPSGQGYFDDARVPLTWSPTQNLLWKTALPGAGNSTPAIWGDRIFLTSASAKGEERYVLCVKTTGEILWKQTAAKGVAPSRTHEMNGYASPSCVTDGIHVYAFFGTPGLFCYDLDGKLIWKKELGIFTADTGWGTSASPILVEDLVIQNCDNSGAKGLPKDSKNQDAAPQILIAFDKKTGNKVWQAERNQGKGFSTPVLIPMPGGRIDLVLNGPFGVWGYDPKTGKEIWHCERHKGDDKAFFGEAIPVFDREKLIMMSGRPGPMMAVRLGGTGDVTRSHKVWDVPRKTPRDVGSPILWKDLLYIGDRQGNISCYDARTGEQVYRERAGTKCFSASPVVVQDRLLFLAEDGQTYVIEPGKQFKQAARNSLGDGSEFRASPVVVDGRIYLRSQTHLYCIGTK
jgi:outer membrane protein assembly factor BamB